MCVKVDIKPVLIEHNNQGVLREMREDVYRAPLHTLRNFTSLLPPNQPRPTLAMPRAQSVIKLTRSQRMFKVRQHFVPN